MRIETDVDLDHRPTRQAGILAQEARGETVLLRLHDGSYYALDEVGATIWHLCDGTRPVSAIITAVGEEFDAPDEQIKADVLEFVADLVGEQLLVLSGG